MKSNDGAQKRKRKRALIIEALEIDGKPIGQAIDLSADGMYITTGEKFEKDSILALTFQLDKKPIEVSAKVVYLHEGIGMGVRFLGGQDEVAERIGAYVEKRSSLSHAGAKSHRGKILIIDDSTFYQNVYQQRLLSEGFSVLLARDGMEGLRVLTKERPDLVLLDLVMDGMDGYKVLHIIKSQRDIKDIPIVVFSVKGSAEEINRAIELGAADYLVKATSAPNKVIEKIKEILRYRQAVS